MAQPKLAPTFVINDFKTADAATRKAIATELFKLSPIDFMEQALNLSAINQQSHLPVIPKEVVEMDDILTQQMISTYRQEIAPLVIFSQKTNLIQSN